MKPELILMPMAAMMLLTFAVWLRLYFTRIPEMIRQRIHPQTIATRAEKRAVHLGDAEARASDNFQNLFELPVIFYALCLAFYAMGTVNTVHLALAWIFVGLRVAHSAVHLFYNKVMHRFVVYAAGGAVLFMLVVAFAMLLI